MPNWIFFAPNTRSTFMQWALAHRIAEKDPVVIVDLPISVTRGVRIPALMKRRTNLQNVESSWHYRPLHFPEKLPGIGMFSRLLNRKLLKYELNQFLPRGEKLIVCYDSPSQYYLATNLNEDVSIYLAIDDRTITVWGDPIRGEIEAEKRLLSRVDKVVCVSETLAVVLMSRIPTDRKIPIHILPNGYDDRLFDPDKKYGEPADLRKMPRPRILVAGYISERIDWEGIRGAVKARPKWTWVFVGPADNGMKEKINALGEGNFYHPPVPVEQVPAWIRHCDACAVPYRLNTFTLASSPLKAIEYLAMGAPVLSTRIPSLQHYDGVIEWVNERDGESYARTLDEIANSSGNQERVRHRQQAVAGDSWDRRVNQFREIVFDAIT